MIRLLLVLLLLAAPAAAQKPAPIYLTPGALIQVLLQENATTGYSWALAASSDTRILERGKDEALKPTSGKAGAPGLRSFKFECKGSGTAKLVFEYRRPWEKGVAPARTFTVDVVGSVQTSPTEVFARAVYVQPGSRFPISLPAAPARGFRWQEPVVTRPEIVRMVDRKDHARGTRFVFQALEPGFSVVTANSEPTPDPDVEPDRTLYLQVTVAR